MGASRKKRSTGCAPCEGSGRPSPCPRRARGRLEKVAEGHCVDGGRRDEQPELRSPAQHLSQQTEEHVRIQAALVRLVDHQGRVTRKQRVGEQLAKEHPIGQVLDASALVVEPLIEAYRVPDDATDHLAHLLRHTLGHRCHCHAPRLSARPTRPPAVQPAWCRYCGICVVFPRPCGRRQQRPGIVRPDTAERDGSQIGSLMPRFRGRDPRGSGRETACGRVDGVCAGRIPTYGAAKRAVCRAARNGSRPSRISVASP